MEMTYLSIEPAKPASEPNAPTTRPTPCACQRAEDAEPDPNLIFQARNRIRIYQPIRVRFKPEIKKIAVSFVEIFMKKKMSFTHPQHTSYERQYLHSQDSGINQ